MGIELPLISALRRRRQKPPATHEGVDLDALATTAADRRIIERALPYTMTGPARLQALIDAVRYCVARQVPGAFAECGVWRGGSILAMLLTLQELGEERDVYLYDTFEGMTEPSAHDVSVVQEPALRTWEEARRAEGHPWGEVFGPQAFNEAAVRETVLSTGFSPERLHIVRGSVLETLPARVPAELSLLRLDTDWYESTRHELIHLYPLLSQGGVLIIDDYGHWEGARKAVDEFLAAQATPLLLSRIDYTARIAVKH